MDEEGRKKIILLDLKTNGESSITDVSRRIKMSQTTVSKYLRELKNENKLAFRDVPPIKYYKLIE